MKIPRTTNDWSTFTPQHIERLIRTTGPSGLGYLIWTKANPSCLARDDFGALLRGEKQLDRHDPSARHVRQAKSRVLRWIRYLRARGVTRITLGVSWCDWVSWAGGRQWIEWYVREFAQHFEILPRITYTPPCRTAEGPANGKLNDPPARFLDYAEFLDEHLAALGRCYGAYVELWNEPNLETDWRFDKDPGYERFLRMIMLGSLVVRAHGKQAVLGGIAGITTESIALLSSFARRGLCRYVDVMGFHDLRGTWGDHEPSAPIKDQAGWVRGTLRTPPTEAGTIDALVRADAASAAEPLRSLLLEQFERLRADDDTPRVWLTEYGFPAHDPYQKLPSRQLQEMQAALFAYAVAALRRGDIERIYWYTLEDFVGESVRKHTTGSEDPLQWHYGDVCLNGRRRLLGRLLEEGGEERALRYAATHGLFPLVDAASLKRQRPATVRAHRMAAE